MPLIVPAHLHARRSRKPLPSETNRVSLPATYGRSERLSGHVGVRFDAPTLVLARLSKGTGVVEEADRGGWVFGRPLRPAWGCF